MNMTRFLALTLGTALALRQAGDQVARAENGRAHV